MAYQIRPMLDSDWPAVSRIYQEGMDTNLATFQAACPAWGEWYASQWLAAGKKSAATDSESGGIPS